MQLQCNLGCGQNLILQDNITRGRKPTVALCLVGNRIVSGPLRQWGDAATRVNYADPEDREGNVTHAIQLGPVDWGDHGLDVGHVDPHELDRHVGEGGSAPLDPESFGGDDFGGVGDDCNAAPQDKGYVTENDLEQATMVDLHDPKNWVDEG